MHLIVEEDAALDFCGPAPAVMEPPQAVTWKATNRMKPRTIKFRVLGSHDKPLPNAAVTLSGEGFPVHGKTNDKGEVSLDLYAWPGGRPSSLLVTAESDHWNKFLPDPELSDSSVNVIRLHSLEETIQDFPEQYHYGWGARIMGLDRLDRRLTGRGVKIALIDSGVDSTHPLLKHIQKGVDLTNDLDTATWAEDLVGHGTHCAGTIGALHEKGLSLRGFAPEAEIHVLKVFPGGRFSTLLEALDLCIQREIDVVNISLGNKRRSLAVEQKLEECVLNGVACIVSAGNSGGAVQYPAVSRWTLAVSAIGKVNEVPLKTWERNAILPSQVAPDGIFSPSFGCVGPDIAVCAPGVGVISTVPGGGFEPQSGSSVAAPHVTGMAALLLAHHPWFASLGVRNHQRVAALFEMIQSMCVPYPFAPGRSGAGLPRLDLLQQVIAAMPPLHVPGPEGVPAAPRPGSTVPFVQPQVSWPVGSAFPTVPEWLLASPKVGY